MYINYMSNWIVEILQIRIPLVLSSDMVFLVTIWDMFMLTVFLGIFIILVKYIITDNIDIKLGDSDINYSSNSYISRQYNNSIKNYSKNRYKSNLKLEKSKFEYDIGNINHNNKSNTVKISKNSIAGRILSKKDK